MLTPLHILLLATLPAPAPAPLAAPDFTPIASAYTSAPVTLATPDFTPVPAVAYEPAPAEPVTSAPPAIPERDMPEGLDWVPPSDDAPLRPTLDHPDIVAWETFCDPESGVCYQLPVNAAGEVLTSVTTTSTTTSTTMGYASDGNDMLAGGNGPFAGIRERAKSRREGRRSRRASRGGWFSGGGLFRSC